MTKKQVVSFLIVTVVVATTIGYFYASSQPSYNYPNYNVLLLTIDTLRADHVGAYGYDKIQTPNIDRIASKGVVFRHAISQVPMTLPSHTTILTGTYPVYHGTRDNGAYIVGDDALTLAEILKEKGYRTAAFVSAFILDSKWGLAQGFDTYFDDFDILKPDHEGIEQVQRKGGETNAAALEWLQKTSQPFFAWVHYYDPHDPYDPPEPFLSEYADAPYDGEIAYVDSLVGQLWNLLEQQHLLEKTIVIVAGDHGEGLGQHYELTHAIFLYDTTLHVPLIWRLPDGKHRSVPNTVQLVDIAPTLLDLLGIKKPETFQGQSLLPFMKRDSQQETVALSETLYSELHYGWSPLYSLTTQRYKFIDAPKAELFDLEKDPDETRNLFSDQPHVANALRNRIHESLVKFAPTTQRTQKEAKVDLESQEMLKALGYIGGGPSLKTAAEGKTIDPKDKILIMDKLHSGFGDLRRKDLQRAEQEVNEVIASDPEIVDGHLLKAMIAIQKQDYPTAISSLQTTLRLKPDHFIAVYDLAVVYRKTGETTKALEGFKEVLRRDPNYVNAMVNLGELLAEQNQPVESERFYKKAIARYQELMKSSTTVEALTSIHEALSGMYFGQGKFEEAAGEFQEILKLNENYPDAHFNLAQIYEKLGKIDRAFQEYEIEIRNHPENFKAYVDYSILLRSQGRHQDAVKALEKAVQLQRDHFGAKFMLADSLVQSGGNLGQARMILQEALQLEPQNSRALQLLRAINAHAASSH